MRTRPLRFAFAFLAVFALLTSGFEASRGTAFERFVCESVILEPTTQLINLVTPAEHVQLVGRMLVPPSGSRLHITRGCEGIEMFLLLIAAIVAFPAPLAHRVRGLLVGSVLAYALSVLRLMSLYYILRHNPALWEQLHGLILPLGPIVLIALYFLRWAAATTPPRAGAAIRAT